MYLLILDCKHQVEDFHHQANAKSYPFCESRLSFIHHQFHIGVLTGVDQATLLFGQGGEYFLLRLIQSVASARVLYCDGGVGADFPSVQIFHEHANKPPLFFPGIRLRLLARSAHAAPSISRCVRSRRGAWVDTKKRLPRSSGILPSGGAHCKRW